jgi:hypothetical protein
LGGKLRDSVATVSEGSGGTAATDQGASRCRLPCRAGAFFAVAAGNSFADLEKVTGHTA